MLLQAVDHTDGVRDGALHITGGKRTWIDIPAKAMTEGVCGTHSKPSAEQRCFTRHI